MKRLALGLIRVYRRYVSPAFGPRCRFYPSCSAYAAESIANLGLIRGSYASLRRLLRCHPWTAGGVDLPPRPRTLHPAHSTNSRGSE